MSGRFTELERIKRLASNQTEVRQSAIHQAIDFLVGAGVEEEVGPIAEGLTIKGFLKRTRRALVPPISQELLARRAGLSLTVIQAMEQGKKNGSNFGVDSLSRVAAASGMDDQTAGWFIKENDPQDVLAETRDLTAFILVEKYREQIEQHGEIIRTRRHSLPNN
jgi:transcriptional regulator with XRE-family HTH domain